MEFTRRGFLLTSLGLLAAGCASNEQSGSGRVGSVPWPDGVPSSGGARSWTPPASGTVYRPTPGAKVAPTPSVANPGASTPGQPASPTVANLKFVPRSQWAQASPITSRINPMGSVNRITIHHEGWNPVYFDDTATTAERLELIRKSHLNRLGAGDIGYHFIIDRAGRVWQGRELRYQGAHVKSNNENNVGVMVLGNFDIQSPSNAQLNSVRDTVGKLMTQFRVPANRVYTHQEINPTACPGRALQPRFVAMRRNGNFT